MKQKFFFLTIFYLMAFLPICAEVERITVSWTAIECTKQCIDLLENQFKKIPGVAEVNLNQSAGQVDLKWKKNVSFSFSPINIAMEMVGLTINDIRVKVHGTLQHTANSVTLVSTGDLTRFDLLNPVVPETYGQAPQFNLAARGLQPELRQQLLEGEAKKKIATVEGPLFMPERSPPLELIVSHVSFADEK